jgi:TolB-like protein/DNA-binding winged helix-turn-helix (wHTH) protein
LFVKDLDLHWRASPHAVREPRSVINSRILQTLLMPDSIEPAVRAQFGPFLADFRAGELFKNGRKIRLQGQPLQVLALLIENPGEVVTREHLRQELWPKDTFVDFDHGLNSAINRLREALNDSAEEPRFIETLPRRGYRFIAKVQIDAKRAPQSGSLHSPIEPKAQLNSTGIEGTATAQTVPGQAPPIQSVHHMRTLWLGAVAVSIFAALSLGLYFGAERHPRANAAARIRSVAVLPLENLSGDPSQEYFADGITDELITEIAHLHPLRVISRTSVLRYKGTSKSLPEIARELGVDAVLEGSFVRSGRQVKVTAQLIEARTDTHLWSGEYTREMRDIISLQREVARDIAHQIHVNLLPEEQARIATASPVNPEAYESFLRGLHFWDQRTPESMALAIKYFNESISREPEFAPAWAYLSSSYCITNFLGADNPKAEYPKAVSAVKRALQLDPTSAEAHTAMACIHNLFEWNWQEGESELRAAIELNPNYALAHQWLSFTFVRVGQPKRSIEEMRLALKLDPLSLRTNLTYENRLLEARRYQEAIDHGSVVVELYPENVTIHELLATAYDHAGRPDRAGQEFDKFLAGDELGRQFNRTCLQLSYLQCKRQFEKARARKQLNDLEQQRKRGNYVSAADFAQAYLQLGEKRKAIQWLQSAYLDGCSIMLSLALPQFDDLRSEPAFQELQTKVGLPQAVQ